MTERGLGGLKEVTVKIRTTWVATSNNAKLDADTASRAIVIRLDTGLEDPAGKKYATNPLEFIESNRSVVISALFLLIRNWQEQGSLGYSGKMIDGKKVKHQSRFHNWQRVIGGILEANQIEGFLDNIQQQRDTLDPEKAAWGQFCKEWRQTHGKMWINASNLRDIASENTLIADEMMGKFADPTGKKENIKLGRMLSSRRDKVFGGSLTEGGYKICQGKPNAQGITYRVLIHTDDEFVDQENEQLGMEI